MASKKKNADVPIGFKEVDNSLAGFWKPTQAGQTLQGIVGNMIEVKGAEGKPNRFYAIRVTDAARSGPIEKADGESVEIEDGDLVGAGGAILVSFMAGREGQEVYLVYKGLGAKKKGRNQAKLYGTYAREVDPATGEVLA